MTLRVMRKVSVDLLFEVALEHAVDAFGDGLVEDLRGETPQEALHEPAGAEQHVFNNWLHIRKYKRNGLQVEIVDDPGNGRHADEGADHPDGVVAVVDRADAVECHGLTLDEDYVVGNIFSFGLVWRITIEAG